MNFSVRRQNFFGVDVKRIPRKGTDLSSRFFDNQTSRRHVPGVELHLPEAVEPSGGDITKVQGRGTRPPDTLRAHAEPGKMIDVVLLTDAYVISETGDQEGPGKGKPGRYPDPSSVESGAFPPLRRKKETRVRNSSFHPRGR